MKSARSLFCLLVFFPLFAQAHSVGGGGGFLTGMAHPVLGFDHLLAMVSVGILSAQMGGRAIWAVPAAFVCMMLVGGVMGMEGNPLFPVELGISFSVFALGIALAAEKKLPPGLAMIFVGVFALFHGHAHGAEMPSLARPVLYALGFMAGTAGIHVFGVILGLISREIPKGESFMRYVGAGIAGIGFQLMIV
ncbi:MAG: HupE/UreJ family protein [Kiritimatiellia bacterium]